MATASTAINMNTFYDDLMRLCAMDDTFYYKDVRLQSITYRIFNYRLCTYAAFQSRTSALNCRGTMFNIRNPKDVKLVCLPFEKFFNYEEGFGRKQFHERGRFGDKMEKMDGSLISTYLHGNNPKEQVLRLKSKQSVTSKQVSEAMQLLTGDFKSEVEQLVRLNYTVDMEFTSPANHVVVSYSEPRLTVLSIRSHIDGQTLFGTQLKKFLLDNHLLAVLDHLVSFQLVPCHVNHKQLLDDIAQEPYGEGYVVQIIQPDQSSYLVKIKTQRYLQIHRDGQPADSPRSLFEAVINEHTDDLRGLFQNDTEKLKRIEEMEENIRPKYNRMIEVIEQFYRTNKHLPKKSFVHLITKTANMTVYLPLLLNLYANDENDYKGFAMKHAKDLFEIDGDTN